MCDVADICRELFHAQEDVQRVLPAGHPLVDQLRGEAAQQQGREPAHRRALRRQVSDDVPAERRPDRLDAERVPRTLDLGVRVFEREKRARSLRWHEAS